MKAAIAAIAVLYLLIQYLFFSTQLYYNPFAQWDIQRLCEAVETYPQPELANITDLNDRFCEEQMPKLWTAAAKYVLHGSCLNGGGIGWGYIVLTSERFGLKNFSCPKLQALLPNANELPE